MKTISCIVLISMIYYSCTSINMIKHAQSDYDELNEELEEEKVTILKFNQEETNGYKIQLSLDSTSWRDSEQNKYSVQTLDIQKISYKSRWGGAKKGFLYGLIGGAIFGLIIYKGAKSELDQETVARDLLGAMAFTGFMGGITGLPIGAVIGNTYSYELHKVQEHEFDQFVRVEFTSLIKKSNAYIIILWKGQEITLLRTEYSYYRGTTEEEKPFIVIPELVYKSKFQEE